MSAEGLARHVEAPQGVAAASSVSKVLVVTISQGAAAQQQQGQTDADGPSTASAAYPAPGAGAAPPLASASKASAESSVLAELPAWGRRILLPPAWCAKLSALSSPTFSGAEAAQMPVLIVWLDTPLGAATATIPANQLLAAASEGEDSSVRVAATLVGRGGGGSSSSAGTSSGSSGSSPGGAGMEVEERGQLLELRARLEQVVPESRTAAAAEQSAVVAEEGGEASAAAGGAQQGEQADTDGSGGGGSDSKQRRHTRKKKRAMRKVVVAISNSPFASVAVVSGGTCKQGLCRCVSEPVLVRALSAAGVVAVVGLAWLQLHLMTSPLGKTVAVLRAAAFIISVLGALAVLPLLGLIKLPAAPLRGAAAAPAGNNTCRASSGGSSRSGRAEAAARARPQADVGEVAPMAPQQWALTLLPAVGKAGGDEAQHKRMTAAAMGPTVESGEEQQHHHQGEELAGSDGSTTPSGEWQIP